MGLKYIFLTVCLLWQLGSSLGLAPCYDEVHDACGREGGLAGIDASVCTAEWGAFPRLGNDTNKLISIHLTQSMQYLLQASHFNEWNINRPGFYNYFGKLAEEEWDSAISLMIHMIKRGGRLTEPFFKIELPRSWENRQTEIESLAWALDLEKDKANRTLHLAYSANHVPKELHNVPRDAEFADFLAERLNNQIVLRIKHLSNYVNMLTQVLRSGVDKAFALFTFDHEILK